MPLHLTVTSVAQLGDDMVTALVCLM